MKLSALLKEVQQLDDSLDRLDILQQLELQRHHLPIDAGLLQHLVPGHLLDGGHLLVVPGPDPSVLCPEATITDYLSHPVGFPKNCLVRL